MRKFAKSMVFQGLDLRIEYPKGSKRPWRDNRGQQQYTTMRADYGEVEGTEGLDGDAVDVYVGPDKTSDRVFVVTQMKKNNWEKVDEEKCVLGVKDKADARDLYLAHYNDPRFCGSIKELSMSEFVKRLGTRGVVGQKIAASAERIAELNYLRLQQGDPVLLNGAHNMRVVTMPLTEKVAEVQDWDPALERMLEQSRKYAGASTDPDPQWDNDLHPDVKRKMKREAPERLEDMRRSAVGRVDVTKFEQIGLGIKEKDVEKDPKDSKMRKAAALASAMLFAKEAASLENPRVARIADRVDDVGIGMLAAPYAAKAVGKSLKGKRGVLGAIGAGANAASKALHKHENKVELGGLALVAPGIGHRVAKGINRVVPGKEGKTGLAAAADQLVAGAVKAVRGARKAKSVASAATNAASTVAPKATRAARAAKAAPTSLSQAAAPGAIPPPPRVPTGTGQTMRPGSGTIPAPAARVPQPAAATPRPAAPAPTPAAAPATTAAAPTGPAVAQQPVRPVGLAPQPAIPAQPPSPFPLARDRARAAPRPQPQAARQPVPPPATPARPIPQAVIPDMPQVSAAQATAQPRAPLNIPKPPPPTSKAPPPIPQEARRNRIPGSPPPAAAPATTANAPAAPTTPNAPAAPPHGGLGRSGSNPQSTPAPKKQPKADTGKGDKQPKGNGKKGKKGKKQPNEAWEAAKGVGRGVRNTAIAGTGALGLGIGASGLAAAHVLSPGGHGGMAPPGYAAPTA